jgi:hypothetical protein
MLNQETFDYLMDWLNKYRQITLHDSYIDQLSEYLNSKNIPHIVSKFDDHMKHLQVTNKEEVK